MAESASLEANILDCIYAAPEEAAKRSTGPRDPGPVARPIGHVDNSHWQSDRLTMAIAATVRHDPCVTLPVAGTRRGDGKRDGFGARQRTWTSGRWDSLELHVSRTEVDNAEPSRARIALNATAQVFPGWQRHRYLGLRAACAS
jgi:hypothetical protein